MIWCGFIVPCRVSSRWIVSSVIEPGALVAHDRHAVDRGDVDRRARRVLGHVARGRQVGVAAAQRGDGRLEPGGDEELERGQHAAVDLAAADVRAPAAVDLDVRVGEDALRERLLAHQQDLADRRRLRVLADERVAAGGAVDRGRLEQLPAVEDRLRVDPRGAAAGRADLEQQVRRVARGDAADAAEDRARGDARAALERLHVDVGAVEAEDAVQVAAEALGELVGLRLAAGGRRVRAVRVGEQALLGGARVDGRRGAPSSPAPRRACAWRPGAPSPRPRWSGTRGPPARRRAPAAAARA